MTEELFDEEIPLNDIPMSDTLKEKVMSAFSGKVVRKDLAFQVKGNLPVPTYVLEYLLAQYCATDDPEIIEAGLEKVKNVIRSNYVNRADAEQIKGKIKEMGTFRIIDNISVTLNDKKDQYEATFANLGLQRIPIGGEHVRANPKLLSGNGVWSIVTIEYVPGEEVEVRWLIKTYKAIQIANVDINDYISRRSLFTTDEWIDFLLHTVGLNPEGMTRRGKLIILSRLLPFVENNYNFMELGPKGTGKSHVFQELSPNGVLVSGGDVTSARLFVKFAGNKEILGLVGYWDLVAWDEFEQQKGKTVDSVMVDTMQNYLAQKSFNRGKATHEASASMCFVGNTKHTVPYMLTKSHMFESIPKDFIKGAFLDRIHFYNPGWEVKILKKSSFSKGYGMITDYIAAVLHELRKQDFSRLMDYYVKFNGSLSERDNLAIRKTFSGMIKLLYPNGEFTSLEAIELVDFATEGRKRVKDQLYIIDETFNAEPVNFEYTILDGNIKVKVETLEKHSLQAEAELNSQESFNEEEETDSTIDSTTSTRPSNGVELKPHEIEIQEGQTGISYKKLFAPYMRGAKVITLNDTFIRSTHQYRNLLEFMSVITTSCDVNDLEFVLNTTNDQMAPSEKIDQQKALQEIADQAALIGLNMSFNIDNTLHDRSIIMDNGWKINLGRGLDIFQRPDSFRSLETLVPEYRKCYRTTFTYLKLD